MCGIVAIIGEVEQKDILLKKLLVASEERGKDATGIFASEFGIIKDGISATTFVSMKRYDKLIRRISGHHVIIGHVRKATRGSAHKNYNNHPLNTKDWVIVHNGTVDAPEEGIKRLYEVDSEYILRWVEKEGFINGIKKLKGTAAIVAYNLKDKNIYIYRHKKPLWFTEVENALVIFSEPHLYLESEGISDLVPKVKFWRPEEGCFYKVDTKKLAIEKLTDETYSLPEYTPTRVVTYWSGNVAHRISTREGKKTVICNECIFSDKNACFKLGMLISKIKPDFCTHFVNENIKDKQFFVIFDSDQKTPNDVDIFSTANPKVNVAFARLERSTIRTIKTNQLIYLSSVIRIIKGNINPRIEFNRIYFGGKN